MNIFLYRHIARLVRQFFLMSTIILLCYSGHASAQSTEVQELELEIEALKKRVQELQSTNCVKAPGPKKRKVTGNPWRALEVNLSKADVISLLGKPGKIDKWKTGEAWYFPNSKGGEVDFDANDKVTGWLEP